MDDFLFRNLILQRTPLATAVAALCDCGRQFRVESKLKVFSDLALALSASLLDHGTVQQTGIGESEH